MIIEITSSDLQDNWYHNAIGKKFVAWRHPNGLYYVYGTYWNYWPVRSLNCQETK